MDGLRARDVLGGARLVAGGRGREGAFAQAMNWKGHGE